MQLKTNDCGSIFISISLLLSLLWTLSHAHIVISERPISAGSPLHPPPPELDEADIEEPSVQLHLYF